MRRLHIIVEGVLLHLCDAKGLSFLIRNFGRVEGGSFSFTAMSSRTAVVAIIQVASPVAVLSVVTVELARVNFVVRLWVSEELSVAPLSQLGQ